MWFSSKEKNISSREYIELAKETEILKAKLEMIEAKHQSLKGYVYRKQVHLDEEDPKSPENINRSVLIPG